MSGGQVLSSTLSDAVSVAAAAAAASAAAAAAAVVANGCASLHILFLRFLHFVFLLLLALLLAAVRGLSPFLEGHLSPYVERPPPKNLKRIVVLLPSETDYTLKETVKISGWGPHRWGAPQWGAPQLAGPPWVGGPPAARVHLESSASSMTHLEQEKNGGFQGALAAVAAAVSLLLLLLLLRLLLQLAKGKELLWGTYRVEALEKETVGRKANKEDKEKRHVWGSAAAAVAAAAAAAATARPGGRQQKIHTKRGTSRQYSMIYNIIL